MPGISGKGPERGRHNVSHIKLKITQVPAGDMGIFDEGVKTAKRCGFNVISLSVTAEVTRDMLDADPNDKWLNYSALNPALMKVVETSLVHDVLSASHIEKNAALLAEQSKILEKHDVKGIVKFREAMWLPESFFEKHPELRGPQVQHPGVALSPRWAPCIDRPEILDHYAEAVRRLLELAPSIGVVSICTNDSGGGICWCTGLYPGPNGPDFCKDIPMGQRMRKWFEAMHRGAADAGKEIEVIFSPTHFGRDEAYGTIAAFPARTRLETVSDGWPNEPFISEKSRDLIMKSVEAGKPAVLSIDPSQGYVLAALSRRPVPYYAYDALREALALPIYGIAPGSVEASGDALASVTSRAIVDALGDVPGSAAEIDRRVRKIACELVGEGLADALTSAWKDVDYALRIQPHAGDTNHMLYTFYSIIGDRWLVRPIVPAPERLADEEKAYYSAHRHGSRSKKYEDKFFVFENVMNYEIDEFKWAVNLHDTMMRYMDRAVETMRLTLEEAPEGPEKEEFRRQYHRVAILRCIWRTQRNVLRCGSIIEYFTGAKKDWFWSGRRKDESYFEAPTYRRLFLEGVDDEMENCREIIKLLDESDEPLIPMGQQESAFVYGKDLPGQLKRKIDIMAAHKDDIDILFPNCPEETFTDPNYAWEGEEE